MSSLWILNNRWKAENVKYFQKTPPEVIVLGSKMSEMSRKIISLHDKISLDRRNVIKVCGYEPVFFSFLICPENDKLCFFSQLRLIP